MRAMRRTAVSFALALLCATAHAGPKDRQVARLASGITAGVSGIVAATGFATGQDGDAFNAPILYTGIGMLAIGPSAGEFYAGQYLTIGMGVRAAGAGLALWTLQAQTKEITCDNATNADQKCTGYKENAIPLLGVAAIIFIGGIWYDVLDAGDAADRYNKKHGYTVTPTVVPTSSGAAPGLSLTGSF